MKKNMTFPDLYDAYHFSVDDVFDSLIDATDKKINLFDQPFFKFLKQMHEKFGISVGLHLFYQKKINGKLRTLNEVADFQDQLTKNSWLFFGPHALNYAHTPYDQPPIKQMETFDKIYTKIERFAGNKAFCQFVRLHFYSESYELADYFKHKGVEALFSTDRAVGGHRLPKAIGEQLQNTGLAEYQGMNFIRTQFRVEYFRNENLNQEEVFSRMKKAFKKYGFVIFYTHEVDLSDQNGRNMTEQMFEAAKSLNLKSIKRA